MDAMNTLSPRIAALPRLTANQAQALTLVAIHGADLRVELPAPDGADAPSGNWHLGLTPGVPDALRQAASYRTDLEWAGAALRLSMPPAALTAWTDARLPDLGAGELPEALRSAALETLLAEAAVALTPVSPGGPVRVLAEPREASLPHAWTLAARSEARGETALMVLEADDLGLMLLAGLLSRVPPGGTDVCDESALPVRLRAEIRARRPRRPPNCAPWARAMSSCWISTWSAPRANYGWAFLKARACACAPNTPLIL